MLKAGAKEVQGEQIFFNIILSLFYYEILGRLTALSHPTPAPGTPSRPEHYYLRDAMHPSILPNWNQITFSNDTNFTLHM